MEKEIKVCQFTEVKKNIEQHFRDHRLIPVLGAGFTCGCNSFEGKVPSGKEVKEYMIDSFLKYQPNIERQKMEEESFQSVAEYYHDTLKEKKNYDTYINYIKNNFTKVELPPYKIKFLKEIDWLYVYTLNIDTGIENNSDYKYAIVPNDKISEDFLKDYSCVIKLHGNAMKAIQNRNHNELIFDFAQYAKHIFTNKVMLNKLQDDFTYNNLIFIGCSLDSELDLVNFKINEYEKKGIEQEKYVYYCTKGKPDVLKLIKLKKYGITHVVIFKNYEDIYRNLLETSEASRKISTDELSQNHELSIKKISFDKNNKNNSYEYLMDGKKTFNLINKSIDYPPFFITRDLVKNIMDEQKDYTIQIIYGSRVSGKTYVLMSLFERFSARETFFFDSTATLGNNAFNKILEKKDAIFIFDTHSLTDNQVNLLINDYCERMENYKNNIILAINYSDKELITVLRDFKDKNKIQQYFLESKLSSRELRIINQRLSRIELPKFSIKKTVLDNIVEISETMKHSTFYKANKIPKTNNVMYIVALILLSINEKLYTTTLNKFDIDKECFEQVKLTDPLISTESVLNYERSSNNTSKTKVVLNAKYWLLRYLGDFSKTKKNQEDIVNAYQMIIKTIVDQKSLKYYRKSTKYIKFSIINEIFVNDKRGQIGLIKKIYEKLVDLLADNPHYFHQRAKCYLWQSGFEKKDINALNEALKYAKIARHNFQIEYDNSQNENLAISLAHVDFTIALIWSKISDIDHNDIRNWEAAIEAIYTTWLNPYNETEFAAEMKTYRLNKRNSIKNVILLQNISKNNLVKRKQTDLISQMRSSGFL